MTQYIALCGYPKAGKTEVQTIISRLYGFECYDDSRPLRQAAMALYGLDEWHVSTQEGKAFQVDVGGQMVPVRKLLGDLGCFLEEKDPFHFPRLALWTCRNADPDGKFVFASVRREQPDFLKSQGALVIEVTRDGCRPSDAFDEYSRSSIDFTIENHYDPANPITSRRVLETRIRAILDPVFACVPA